MGTFDTTYSITYLNGSFDQVQGPFTGTVSDGEVDDTFEVGDTATAFSTGNTYLGTVTANGQDWPAFSYDLDPQ